VKTPTRRREPCRGTVIGIAVVEDTRKRSVAGGARIERHLIRHRAPLRALILTAHRRPCLAAGWVMRGEVLVHVRFIGGTGSAVLRNQQCRGCTEP
jgi:hypothetical protein